MSHFSEFLVHHWDLFLALFILIGLLGNNLFGSRLRGFFQIDPFEAVKLINHNEAVIVDVREDKEYTEGHLADAIHIPLGQLRQRLGELEPYRERPLIAVCRSGNRSASACGVLRKNNFVKVFNLRGGVMAWQNANLPLARKGNRKAKRSKK